MKQMGADALGIQNVGFGGVQKPAEEEQPVQQPNKLVVPRPMTKAPVPIRPKATPLILVPPASGAILNMYNIKEFLEKGVFVPPEEARARSPQKPTYERCMRIEGRKHPGVKYHITDRDPTKKEDWDRLVAVCCLGKAWQFKKWPYRGAASGDMVETFLKVAGVFFHYADEPIDPLVKKWNVKLIPISRHSRDTDDAAMRAFWQHVDAFLHARHPNVAY
jgi:parafibromin